MPPRWWLADLFAAPAADERLATEAVEFRMELGCWLAYELRV